MYDGKKLTRLLAVVLVGLWSSASCKHNDGPSPMSPSSPGARSPDSGTTTHPNGIDDTKTGEPIGPVSIEPLGRAVAPEIANSPGSSPSGLRAGSPVAARAGDGLGGVPGGSGGAPGLGGASGGGMGAMGGLPQPSPTPTIGGR